MSISRVSDLRKHLTYVLMMDNKSQDRNVAEETSCFVTFLQLAPRGKDEAGILSTIYVMDVLKEIYEVC